MKVTNAVTPASQLDFLVKLQRILNEGQFVASYKYALLLTLAEISVERTVRPDGTLHISLPELADRFITLYWRHTAPFKSGALLTQNLGRQASAITLIAAFRGECASTLAQAKRHVRWPKLVKQIARILEEMPLWKLQTVGRQTLDFLYENRLIEKGVVLRAGIADCFKQQYPVVQAVVQMAWLTYVQRLPNNRVLLGSTGDLAEFMFGAERMNLGRIVDGLRDMQASRCFYCHGSLRDRVEVDHFIPWVQYGRDLGHNFVLAHKSCNQNKRDMLAAPVHLERWLDRNLSQGSTMQDILDGARFVYDLDASLSVAEWSYERAEKAGALVWMEMGRSKPLTGEWRDLFSA